MSKKIEIIDCGRGPQLSTSRITVQDVVPSLQRNCTPEEIMELIPALRLEEIQVIQEYVRDNYDAVMEQDRRIRARTASRVIPPAIQTIRDEGHALAAVLINEFAKKKARESNGDNPPG